MNIKTAGCIAGIAFLWGVAVGLGLAVVFG